MSKKQSIFGVSQDILFFIALFLTVVVCFFLLVPKVASDLFPWKRQVILQNFLQETEKAQEINAQSFWEFREFYSPGYYTFDRNGLSGSPVERIEKKVGIQINNPHIQTTYIDKTFLIFTSPHLTSIDALVTTNDLTKIIVMNSLHPVTTFFSAKNELIYKDANGNIHILFVKSIQEMKTANGYFDYTGTDASLLKGKYWLDATVLDGK